MLRGLTSDAEWAFFVSQPTLSSQIPQALKKCGERPSVGSIRTQAGVTERLVRVDEARQDCRTKLRALDGALADIDAALKR